MGIGFTDLVIQKISQIGGADPRRAVRVRHRIRNKRACVLRKGYCHPCLSDLLWTQDLEKETLTSRVFYSLHLML